MVARCKVVEGEVQELETGLAQLIHSSVAFNANRKEVLLLKLMCICVYVYVYMCVCMCACVCLSAHAHACIRSCKSPVQAITKFRIKSLRSFFERFRNRSLVPYQPVSKPMYAILVRF